MCIRDPKAKTRGQSACVCALGLARGGIEVKKDYTPPGGCTCAFMGRGHHGEGGGTGERVRSAREGDRDGMGWDGDVIANAVLPDTQQQTQPASNGWSSYVANSRGKEQARRKRTVVWRVRRSTVGGSLD